VLPTASYALGALNEVEQWRHGSSGGCSTIMLVRRQGSCSQNTRCRERTDISYKELLIGERFLCIVSSMVVPLVIRNARSHRLATPSQGNIFQLRAQALASPAHMVAPTPGSSRGWRSCGGSSQRSSDTDNLNAINCLKLRNMHDRGVSARSHDPNTYRIHGSSTHDVRRDSAWSWPSAGMVNSAGVSLTQLSRFLFGCSLTHSSLLGVRDRGAAPRAGG
jgi:hypothetical protein